VLTGIFMVGPLERRDPTVLQKAYDFLAVMIVFACGLVILAPIG
jgi:hypothetical protein